MEKRITSKATPVLSLTVSMGKDAKCGKRVYQKQKAGLHVDVIQSPPLCRMYFSQYQASSASLD